MLGIRAQIGFALAALFLTSTCLASATQRPAPRKTHVKSQPAQPTQSPSVAEPAPPQVPLTPAQMPASAPHVAYANGALTIVAENSTMGDILRAVHAQTGAVMEISGNASERVVSHFGPGSPRDVLAQLLSGSSFNYVILGSPSDAGMVQRVILTPKSAGAEEAQAQSVPSANSVPSAQTTPQSSQQMTEDDSDDSSDSEAQDEQTTPAPGSDQPANPPAGQSAVKTPEQLLQELQRQQQIQQQLQQSPPQQSGGEPRPNPRQQ